MSERMQQPWLVKQPVVPRSGAEVRWAKEALDLIRRSPLPILACVALMYALASLASLLAFHHKQEQIFRNVLPACCGLIGPFLICTSVLIRIADLGKAKSQWKLAYQNALNLWADLIFLPVTLTIVSILPLTYILIPDGSDPFRFTNLVRYLALLTAVSPVLSGIFHFQCLVFESGDPLRLRMRARRAVGRLKVTTVLILMFVPAVLSMMTPAFGGGALIVVGTVFGLVYQYCAWREVFGQNLEYSSEDTQGDQT